MFSGLLIFLQKIRFLQENLPGYIKKYHALIVLKKLSGFEIEKIKWKIYNFEILSKPPKLFL